MGDYYNVVIYWGCLLWLAYMFMFGARNFVVRIISMFTTRNLDQSGLGGFLDLCAFLYIFVIIKEWDMIMNILGRSGIV
jgi:hypothetical protein